MHKHVIVPPFRLDFALTLFFEVCMPGRFVPQEQKSLTGNTGDILIDRVASSHMLQDACAPSDAAI